MAQKNAQLGELLRAPLSERKAVSDSYIICGSYTPDCANWVFPVRQRLDALGVAHDFVENTATQAEHRTPNMRVKPLGVRDAMDRNPSRTVIFLDAHCRVVGTREDLKRLADIKGDVGIRMRTVYARHVPLLVPSGATLVFRPTAEARIFVERWIEASTVTPLDWSEQESLLIVLGDIPMISVTNVGAEFCTEADDKYPRPVILHASGKPSVKTGRLAKFASWLRR